MTLPAPTFATAARSAAEEEAEISAWIATHTEDVSRLRLKLAKMPVNDTQRRNVRARLAEALAAIEDAKEARAALVPRLEAEAAEADYRERLREWHGALGECEALAEQASDLERQIVRMVANIAILSRNCARTAARARLPMNPNALFQPIPDGDRFTDILLGRLCAAGLLDADAMPARYAMSDLPAVQMVARDSAGAAVADMHRAIAAQPPRSPAAMAREEAERAARAEREEAALRKPLPPRQPAPAPVEHRATR
jgi:hypothetical protein